MPSPKKPLIFAHRGERILAPENTLKGCQLALEQGADGLEVDVRQCRDGNIVLFHDALLRKHFNRLKPVAACSITELKSFRFNKAGYKYPGYIATLDDFLEEFKGRVPINLDAKSLIPNNRNFARKLIVTLDRHRLKDQVWISSFNPILIKNIKQINPTIRTGFLFQDPLRVYQAIDVFLSSDAWHPHHQNLSKAFVAKAKRKNKKLYVWTVNKEKTLKKVLRYDIDGIISDVFFRSKEQTKNKNDKRSQG